MIRVFFILSTPVLWKVHVFDGLHPHTDTCFKYSSDFDPGGNSGCVCVLSWMSSELTSFYLNDAAWSYCIQQHSPLKYCSLAFFFPSKHVFSLNISCHNCCWIYNIYFTKPRGLKIGLAYVRISAVSPENVRQLRFHYWDNLQNAKQASSYIRVLDMSNIVCYRLTTHYLKTRTV